MCDACKKWALAVELGVHQVGAQWRESHFVQWNQRLRPSSAVRRPSCSLNSQSSVAAIPSLAVGPCICVLAPDAPKEGAGGASTPVGARRWEGTATSSSTRAALAPAPKGLTWLGRCFVRRPPPSSVRNGRSSILAPSSFPRHGDVGSSGCTTTRLCTSLLIPAALILYSQTRTAHYSHSLARGKVLLLDPAEKPGLGKRGLVEGRTSRHQR